MQKNAHLAYEKCKCPILTTFCIINNYLWYWKFKMKKKNIITNQCDLLGRKLKHFLMHQNLASTLLSWIPSYHFPMKFEWKSKICQTKMCKLKKNWTHVASPRKSSWLKLSLSIILRLSSEALSETVKRKLSFHCGLDPAPAIHNTKIKPPSRKCWSSKLAKKCTFCHSAFVLLGPVCENHIRIYVGCILRGSKKSDL